MCQILNYWYIWNTFHIKVSQKSIDPIKLYTLLIVFVLFDMYVLFFSQKKQVKICFIFRLERVRYHSLLHQTSNFAMIHTKFGRKVTFLVEVQNEYSYTNYFKVYIKTKIKALSRQRALWL